MNLEEKRSVLECYVHAFNSFDVDSMVSLLDPDAKYTCILDGKIVHSATGVDEFRCLGEQWQSLFSSRKLTIMECYEKDNQVIMEISYAAVVAADSLDKMKAGDTLKLDGVSEITFRDEKILSITDIY